IFRKWELDFAVIGEVTDTGHMVLEWGGDVVCDIPLGPLADEAPLYDRPHLSLEEYKAWARVKPLGDVPESTDLAADLLKLMACPDLASRRWIWEQYDSQVGADTLQKSGGDAAVVRIHGTRKALAMSTDCTPRYCYADPYEGGKQAVAETWRNISAVGARPLAITNCLNFANPQRPEIMAQIVECLRGMGDACRALDYPIVSGNVSLYNESKATGGGSAILPTPAIGGVGLMDDHAAMATIAFKAAGEDIVVIGYNYDQLGQSLYLREIHGREDGDAPVVDLELERKLGEAVRSLVANGTVSAVHDVSDGGLLVAIAEMALGGNIGAELDGMNAGLAFGEAQSRYVVTLPDADALEGLDLPLMRIGKTGGNVLEVNGKPIPLATLRKASDSFFRDWMES
ncbi:MAG: phosphoribosylformylglycinamidine synthase II, partial [Novosphingobium sp.]|nr:phosphoribosylformylglycinamidine synthase II [Novosphingobium sp.]